ncbi:hypothetical protein N9E30_05195 [Flavobacteriales bacterium]|jgi:hypothetical protein|nr:hypothetical protein [Flavobacteriales bacterium]
MLKFCQTILQKVSFDKQLFKKELRKSAGLLNKHELLLLKIWCLTTFSNYKSIIIEVFESTI